MIVATNGVKLYDRSMLYKEGSYMLIAIHGVKLMLIALSFCLFL